MHEERAFSPTGTGFHRVRAVLRAVRAQACGGAAGMLDDRGAKVRTELRKPRGCGRSRGMLRDAEARRADALREAQALIEGPKRGGTGRSRSWGGSRGVGEAARADGAGRMPRERPVTRCG